MKHEPPAGATDSVSLRYFLPAPDLRTAISTYYVLRIGEGPIEDLLHPEWGNVRLLLQGHWSAVMESGATSSDSGPVAMVSGPLSRSARVKCGPGLLVGAGLMPAGWARLTSQSAADYADRLRPLSDLVNGAADDLLTRVRAVNDEENYCAVLDDWFRAQLAPDTAVGALLDDAHRALLDPDVVSVTDWASRLGRSTRQLERLALDYFGISPKRLLRRQRFLRTFVNIRDAPIGEWGRQLDLSYEDQPHFIREFRHFIGMPPKAYFSRQWPFMLAATRARQALLGAPMQSLHRPQ